MNFTMSPKARNYTALALSAVGVVGTGALVYSTVKTTSKATRKIIAEEATLGRELSNKEKFQLIWKDCLVTAGIGAVTAGVQIGSGVLSYKNAAAYTSAIEALKRGYSRYRMASEKVLSPEQKKEISDIMRKTDPKPTGKKGSKQLYWDEFGGWWWAYPADVNDAKYFVNKQFASYLPVSLGEFYKHAKAEFCNKDLSPEVYQTIGWSIPQFDAWGTSAWFGYFIEFKEDNDEPKDGVPVISLSFIRPLDDFIGAMDDDQYTDMLSKDVPDEIRNAMDPAAKDFMTSQKSPAI